MPPKGGPKHASNLSELVKAFAEAFKTSQEQLAKAYDDLASGYQKHDSKLPKTRPRIPFAEWASREIEGPILRRVLEARFEAHWDSLKKSEQTRRVQALEALGLEHSGELYMWFGEAAVASRDAWLGLDSLEVTAATLFSEIIAGRAEKNSRPLHYLRTAFTPSEVIAAKKRLPRIKPEVKKNDPRNKLGEVESQENRVVEDSNRISDNSIQEAAVQRGGDIQDQGSDIFETSWDSISKDIEAHRAVHNTGSARPLVRDEDAESPLQNWNADQPYDANESSSLLFNDETSVDSAMRINTNRALGAGMGAAASRVSPGAEGASPDDSAIGMEESDGPVMNGSDDSGNPKEAFGQPRPAVSKLPHDGKALEAPHAESENADDALGALEDLFRTGLARITRARDRISTHKNDEKAALNDCAELKDKMVHLNARLIARADELLRATDGSEEEWTKYSQGHLEAGKWEKELIEAGGKKRKRSTDASTSQKKRAKIECCAERVAQQVKSASQTFNELEKLCETD
ncbi:hypothetical protein GCG54_00015410 [Colletotrichum gloeosporioides]|uniref:Uncharacterized protein n=1 Tax=Colletotrichum gloeosporioides TaxID=474922 RepID=A0A8H4FKW1_COLGL|nr:uncharacterized protein GCG54_00015410 [Colletotrichum gloeosporioides]KAF3805850.1 hypothetical protein GCG54_00015410 [Colletotrichum gloeosporioides]